jgi:hypothetical protein
MPLFVETEFVDVETCGAVYVGYEEDRARVPSRIRFFLDGLLRH